jgi:hypothetical protein
MGFRDQVAAMDEQLLSALSDEALVEGRPVQGFFSAPWVQAKFGRTSTGIREPVFGLLAAQAEGVVANQTLVIDLPPADGGGTYTIVKTEPDGTGWVNLVLRIKA